MQRILIRESTATHDLNRSSDPGSEHGSTAVQAYLHVLVDCPGSQLQLPVEMMQRARTVWLASARKVRISQLHRDVSRVLAELGVAHAKEQLTEDQLFSVDIALTGGHRSRFLLRCPGGHSCCKGAQQICCQPVAPCSPCASPASVHTLHAGLPSLCRPALPHCLCSAPAGLSPWCSCPSRPPAMR